MLILIHNPFAHSSPAFRGFSFYRSSSCSRTKRGLCIRFYSPVNCGVDIADYFFIIFCDIVLNIDYNKRLIFIMLLPAYIKHQRFLGAEIRAFAAPYTFIVVYYGRAEARLRKRPDGAYLNRGARVVLRTIVLNQHKFFRHNLLLKFIFFYTALLVDFFSYYRNSLFRALGKATIAHCAFIVKRYFVFGKLYILHRAHRNAQSARNTLRVIRFYAAVIIFSFFTEIQPLPE